MHRNAESRFAVNPTNIDMSRSRFDRDSVVKLSFNEGSLIPFYVDEVLPGDTFSIDVSKVVRLQTLITPLMDNLFLDTYWFFVPNRLVWDHWREFMGENTQSAWIPSTEYSIPQITAPAGGWKVGTLADYLGIPTGVANLSVSHLPFRAYALICNEWFRDENLTAPLVIDKGDATVTGVNYTGSNYFWASIPQGVNPMRVAKYHDYFTSCLPSPQKGPDVTISAVVGGLLPVNAYPQEQNINSLPKNVDSSYVQMTGFLRDDPRQASARLSIGASSTSGSALAASDGTTVVSRGFVPTNLYAGNAGNISVATINQLRTAFQIQKLYEKDARGGTRYIEMLKAHFGVTSPDYRLQRPEYLGGSRIPIHISQVIQQSATGSDSTPQGNVSGMSLTTDREDSFTKSFTEHGFVFGLMVVRHIHTYQQGIERFWSRKSRFDYYFPVFANLGEMAVLNKEIYAQGSSVDDEVFGYQEAWADYRYKPSRVAGQMRSQYTQSLDSWHLADYYSAKPSLSSSWMREDPAMLDRALAVSSSVSNQFIADIFIKNKTTRVMPLYSIPGLIDHH